MDEYQTNVTIALLLKDNYWYARLTTGKGYLFESIEELYQMVFIREREIDFIVLGGSFYSKNEGGFTSKASYNKIFQGLDRL